LVTGLCPDWLGSSLRSPHRVAGFKGWGPKKGKGGERRNEGREKGEGWKEKGRKGAREEQRREARVREGWTPQISET